MAALLVGLSFAMGPIQLLKLYGVPYWVNSRYSIYYLTMDFDQTLHLLLLSIKLQGSNLIFLGIQVFVMWLDFVTYLHHHGHEDKLPWYRGQVQYLSSLTSYKEGALIVLYIL